MTLRGGQTFPVAAVVNAAGPDAGRVAAMVGRRLPMGAATRAGRARGDAGGGDPLRRPVETDHIAVRPDGPGRVFLVLPSTLRSS